MLGSYLAEKPHTTHTLQCCQITGDCSAVCISSHSSYWCLVYICSVLAFTCQIIHHSLLELAVCTEARLCNPQYCYYPYINRYLPTSADVSVTGILIQCRVITYHCSLVSFSHTWETPSTLGPQLGHLLFLLLCQNVGLWWPVPSHALHYSLYDQSHIMLVPYLTSCITQCHTPYSACS